MRKKKKRNYNEISGDLIKLAMDGVFDVITHGCNCQNAMGAGIAPKMADAFGARIVDDYVDNKTKSNFGIKDRNNHNRLGTNAWWRPHDMGIDCPINLIVCNSYTQLHPGIAGPDGIPLDYVALQMCLRKLNYRFKGLHIGLPKIGCGLGGANWEKVKLIIQQELKDCVVTVVNYNG